MRDEYSYYPDVVTVYDAIKYLFEAKKDQHAVEVMKLIEKFNYVQGQLDIAHNENTKVT
jgi:hypothetical protein